MSGWSRGGLAAAAVALLLALGGPALAAVGDGGGGSGEDPEWVEGELIVSYEKGVSPVVAAARIAAAGGEVAKRFPIINGYHVELLPGVTYDSAKSALESAGGVRYVSHNFYVYPTSEAPAPNDPRFDDQWNMRNTGQADWQGNLGTPGADVSGPEAWQVSTGEGQVIAMVDEGMNLAHEDLAPNVWVNADEVPGNGVDDDANGYVDDVNGIDSIDGDSDPHEVYSHGNRVGGVLAAEADNGVGIAGMAPDARIMPLRAIASLSDDGLEPYLGVSASIIEAIEYAIAKHAHVINNSWGYRIPVHGGGDPNVWLAIQEAGERDISVVFSAGNTSVQPSFPQTLPFTKEHVIVVTASNRNDLLCDVVSEGQLLWQANPNPAVNDLAAPGCEILTAWSFGYSEDAGTSFAAPHVAGASALLRSIHPQLTAREVKCLVKDSVDTPPGLELYSSSGGRLNARAALDLAAVPGSTDDCPLDP